MKRWRVAGGRMRTPTHTAASTAVSSSSLSTTTTTTTSSSVSVSWGRSLSTTPAWICCWWGLIDEERLAYAVHRLPQYSVAGKKIDILSEDDKSKLMINGERLAYAVHRLPQILKTLWPSAFTKQTKANIQSTFENLNQRHTLVRVGHGQQLLYAPDTNAREKSLVRLWQRQQLL